MIWTRVMFSSAGLFGAPDHVIDRLGHIVRALKAEVVLFDCVYDSDLLASQPAGTAVDAAIRQHVELRRREVEAFADLFRAQALKVRVDVHWDHPPHEAIVRHVLRHQPDLLVMPTSRARMSEQHLLSYTDHRLIEACPCPLLLLRKRAAYSHGTVLAAVDPMHPNARPAGLDELILQAANTIARTLGGVEVHVCHLLPPEYQLGRQEPGALAGQFGTDRAAEVARLISVAERLRHMAALHDIPAPQVHVQFGRVLEGLPSLARELRADVLVMGAVSRSLPRRAIYTETAERLLGVLDCDVLVVKPRNFRCPVSRRAPQLAARTPSSSSPQPLGTPA